MIRLYRDSNRELRFPNNEVPKSPRLRRYVEQKRLEGERQHAERERLHAEHMRLHAEHMRLLGEADPTQGREIVHVVGDESEEEALWRAWCAYST